MRPCSGGAAAPTLRRPLDAARPEATERRAFKPDRARARATNVGDERSYEMSPLRMGELAAARWNDEAVDYAPSSSARDHRAFASRRR